MRQTCHLGQTRLEPPQPTVDRLWDSSCIMAMRRDRRVLVVPTKASRLYGTPANTGLHRAGERRSARRRVPRLTSQSSSLVGTLESEDHRPLRARDAEGNPESLFRSSSASGQLVKARTRTDSRHPPGNPLITPQRRCLMDSTTALGAH